MIVMPANNSNAHTLNIVFPDRLGMLFSPAGKRQPRRLKWAMDNGIYSAWVKTGYSIDKGEQRKHWDEKAFLDMLAWSTELDTEPEWVVVPDVPANPEETILEFNKWRGIVEDYGYTPALAVQDGMTPSDVPEGVICFMGGTNEFKWPMLDMFCREIDNVHVGRVNSYHRLWQCHDAGAASVDGTGFFRGCHKQLKGLIDYLKEAHGYEARKVQQELF